MRFQPIRAVKRGFTLIELVTVIVILGVLAALALPRFVDLHEEARIAAVQGFAAQVTAAAQQVHAKWAVSGGTGLSSVQAIDGSTITVDPATGYPTVDAAGIVAAMSCESTAACHGMKINYGGFGVLFTPQDAFVGTCTAFYLATTPLEGMTTTAVDNCRR